MEPLSMKLSVSELRRQIKDSINEHILGEGPFSTELDAIRARTAGYVRQAKQSTQDAVSSGSETFSSEPSGGGSFGGSGSPSGPELSPKIQEPTLGSDETSIKWLLNNLKSGTVTSRSFLAYWLIPLVGAFVSVEEAENIDKLIYKLDPEIGLTLSGLVGETLLDQMRSPSEETRSSAAEGAGQMIGGYSDEKQEVAAQQIANIILKTGGQASLEKYNKAMGITTDGVEEPEEANEPDEPGESSEVPITSPHHPDFDWGSL